MYGQLVIIAKKKKNADRLIGSVLLEDLLSSHVINFFFLYIIIIKII